MMSSEAAMIIAGRILKTKAKSCFDFAVRSISLLVNASALFLYAVSNCAMRGLLAKYSPALTATKNKPATNNGQTKALAMGVLPNCQKPSTIKKTAKLIKPTIFAEKTSALAQSVLSFMISICCSCLQFEDE